MRGRRELVDVVVGSAVQEMKVLWPFGIALRGEIPNRPELRWLKTVVVSVREKARMSASGGDREDERKRTADDVSKSGRWHQNRGGEQVSG
jgi:hypothetical protein